jgi:hypothetical protein
VSERAKDREEKGEECLEALQKLQIRVAAVEVGSILRGREENGVGVKEKKDEVGMGRRSTR